MGYMNKAKQLKDPTPVAPQRFTWKTIGTYDTHAEARAGVVKAQDKGAAVLKIKLRGDRFEVRKGAPLAEAKSNTP